MRLPDDAIAALWSLYDQSGIRPEYVLPVLYFESNFDPSVSNASGAPYYGIGQDGGSYLQAHGIAPADYLAMSAADQLTAIVVPRLVSFARQYGTPRSATRVYQANFLPGTYTSASLLWSPLVPAGTAIYKANPFDWQGKGAIVLADLSRAMSRAAAAPETRDAIARAYAQRPSALPPSEPVFGEDYAADPWAALLLCLAGALAALAR